MSKPVRIVVAALSLSAAGYAGIVGYESYTSVAVVPTKGDRWTVGFGSTFRDDGSPVQMGDTITPPQAIKRSVAHIAKDETGLKRCVTGELHQAEFDILIDFSYQYGVSATCRSGMVRHINAGEYEQACNAYLQWKMAGGFDCSTPGNTRCRGVWTRQLERQAKCLAAQ